MTMEYGSMIKAGIIDPAKVTRSAVQTRQRCDDGFNYRSVGNRYSGRKTSDARWWNARRHGLLTSKNSPVDKCLIA